MPHEVETMTFATPRGLPWHIGETADVSVGRDDLGTSDEVLVAGGIDWTVTQRHLYVPDGTGGFEEVPGWVGNVRDSDNKTLGVVRPSYKLVQNADLLAFGDMLVDSGEAKWDTAGSLRGGQLVFASMVLPDGIKVPGDDSGHDLYLLLTNGHDGWHSLKGVVTVVRAVCMNTVSAALGGAQHVFNIKHNQTLDGMLMEARRALGITFQYAEVFEQTAGQLVGKTFSEGEVESIFRTLWPVPDGIAPSKFEQTSFAKAFENWKTTDTLDERLRGTGWGVFNAITEYLDHEADYRGGRRVDAESARAESLIMGRAADLKDRALSLLVKA